MSVLKQDEKSKRALRIIPESYMNETGEDILIVTHEQFSKITKDPKAFAESMQGRYSEISYKVWGIKE